jgi:hypothetical protein
LGKEELENQFPSVIKKKYLSYTAFAGQTMEDVFANKLVHAKKYAAEILSSLVLINNKKNGFIITSLSSQVQWSPVFAFFTDDFNHDGTTDILAVGNFYGVLPYEGRYDASYGTVLLNEQNAGFKIPTPLQSGFMVDGETRDIKMIKTIKGKKMIAVARNNDTIRIFSLQESMNVGIKK